MLLCRWCVRTTISCTYLKTLLDPMQVNLKWRVWQSRMELGYTSHYFRTYAGSSLFQRAVGPRENQCWNSMYLYCPDERPVDANLLVSWYQNCSMSWTPVDKSGWYAWNILFMWMKDLSSIRRIIRHWFSIMPPVVHGHLIIASECCCRCRNDLLDPASWTKSPVPVFQHRWKTSIRSGVVSPFVPSWWHGV